MIAGERLTAQTDFYRSGRDQWLQKAASNLPELVVTEKKPVAVVKIVQNEQAFQGWEALYASSVDSFYATTLHKTQPTILDFGAHLTGYFTFVIKPTQVTPDSPLRLKFTFGEVPSEMAVPFDPYTGGLSRAWLQDEIVTVMTLPNTITIPRRLSFRYVKIEVVASPHFDFHISEMKCHATSSAASTPPPLHSSADEMIMKIDQVALNTLRECMQTVYEDGPKRDQRLWIGDLYLQSMSNNYSFGQYDLTRRCLYLLAGLSHTNGYLHPCVYERPEPHGDKRLFLLEYALLYNATLKDYLEATGDKQTALDLWPVAKRQLDIIREYLNEEGLMDFVRANKEWWIFIDWREELHKEVSLQGVSIFALQETVELAQMIGKESEVKEIPSMIKRMIHAARNNFYDRRSGFFVGTLSKQVSYASQVWMILSGVATEKEAQKALTNLSNAENVCYPGTPYLYHYYIQSLIDSGLHQEAKKALTNYWGGMIEKGADTFWEAYDPKNDLLSPYNFYPINSYCHAWSCTPVYF
ncbi:MAG: glycoside hydrolase, partial [Proteiniphilum sp.]|nr:glycoside hydrolase [Proteiniphilum sp.]